jgi:hypothetical protein
MGGLGLGDINGADDFLGKKEIDQMFAVGGGVFPRGGKLVIGHQAHLNQPVN